MNESSKWKDNFEKKNWETEFTGSVIFQYNVPKFFNNNYTFILI